MAGAGQNYTNTDITVPAASAVIAARYTTNGASYTWTNLTERSDYGFAPSRYSSASAAFAAAQNPLSIGVNASAAPFDVSFIAGCFK